MPTVPILGGGGVSQVENSRGGGYFFENVVIF